MPKTKFTIEYDMRGVPISLLWQYITMPQDIELWFADEVKQDGRDFCFIWNGVAQEASLVSIRPNSYVRFHWKDDGRERTFFELKIAESELTTNKTLVITDFADSPEDVDDAKELWNQSIEQLKRNLGCA